jgi:hypothetical protein
MSQPRLHSNASKIKKMASLRFIEGLPFDVFGPLWLVLKDDGQRMPFIRLFRCFNPNLTKLYGYIVFIINNRVLIADIYTF